MSKIKVNLVVIGCVIFSSFWLGCFSFKGYNGDNPELFTVAMSSLLEVKGFIKSEIQHQSVLKIIETDPNGRKLFCYSEAEENGAVNLLISQKADDNYVYFYPDYNFISQPLAEGNIIRLYGSKKAATIENPLNNFTENDIAQLKEKNDWGKEIEETKCLKTDIIRKKKEGPLKYAQMASLCEELVTNTGHSGTQRDVNFFTTDNFGRSMYVLCGKATEQIEDQFVAVLLFNADGTYNKNTCVLNLKDKYNYQNDLKMFKQLNNWNQAC